MPTVPRSILETAQRPNNVLETRPSPQNIMMASAIVDKNSRMKLAEQKASQVHGPKRKRS